MPLSHRYAAYCRQALLSFALLALPLALSSCTSAASVSKSVGPLIPAAGSSKAQVEPESRDEVLAAIARTQAVYLGENHTSTVDHAAQLEIVQSLDAQNDIAIGLEMFQRPFQPVLDAYLAGEITEAELIAQSEYETRWGFPWEFYAPIVRYAKANQIPLIALNTPAEVTRQVARQGLESLSGDALKYIPPVEDVDTTDEAYREWVSAVFNAHGGHGNSLDFENFFAAQVLWDETMAEGIVKQLEADPERQVIVLVGEGHIAYGFGIPNRVARRLPDIDHASVRLAPPGEAIEPGFSDLVWPTSAPE